MIKRYSITLAKSKLSKYFEAVVDSNYTPIFNGAPGHKLPVITSDNPHKIELFQWGIIPYNSSDSGIGEKLINARAKTLFAKEPFCNLVQKKRCIIPSDGFYIWKEQHNVSTPYRVVAQDNNIFGIAGVWDQWKLEDSDTMFGSFTMVTREARKDIEEYSERMPLILNTEEQKNWLDDKISEDFIHKVLDTPAKFPFNIYKVTNLVDNTEINNRRVIKKINAPMPGDTLSLF